MCWYLPNIFGAVFRCVGQFEEQLLPKPSEINLLVIHSSLCFTNINSLDFP